VLECVANVSEGRGAIVLDALAGACGAALLDRHVDPDHHRSVFTLAGPGPDDAASAVRRLADAVASAVDLRGHSGVHPRLGALDVVPFVALDGDVSRALHAARDFATWWAEYGVPIFFYDLADTEDRPLPSVRRDAFAGHVPDLGPSAPHPALGATAVGVRPPMVAVNCVLRDDDLALAHRIAARVRESSGGMRGVRALGFALASQVRAQVSMNLVDLDATGLEAACTEVRAAARENGNDIVAVELVGLVPAVELARCSDAFRAWARIDDSVTIEARLSRR